jgi:hypothetical protein
MVINKTGTDLSSPLSLTGVTPIGSAQVYRYSGANLNAIVRQPDAPMTPGGLTTTFAANSITLLVIPTQANPLPPPAPTGPPQLPAPAPLPARQPPGPGLGIPAPIPMRRQ